MPSLQELIEGIHTFQRNDFRSLHPLFERLAHGQNPTTLFITCSDSRIDPNLLWMYEILRRACMGRATYLSLPEA